MATIDDWTYDKTKKDKDKKTSPLTIDQWQRGSNTPAPSINDFSKPGQTYKDRPAPEPPAQGGGWNPFKDFENFVSDIAQSPFHQNMRNLPANFGAAAEPSINWVKSFFGAGNQKPVNPLVDEPLGGSGGSAPQSRGTLMDVVNQLLASQEDTGGGGDYERVSAMDFSPVRQDAENQATRNRAALQGIYSKLASELGSSNQAIDTRYANAGQQIQQQTDQTSQAVSDSYATAQAEQQQALSALGLESTIAEQISEGRDLAGRGAAAQERVLGAGQSDLANNTAIGASEGTYGGRIQQAGNVAGANAQSELEASLSTRLAEIAQMQAQANYEADAQNQQAAAAARSGGGSNTEQLFSQAKMIYDSQRDDEQQQWDNNLALGKFNENSTVGKLQGLQSILEQLGFKEGEVDKQTLLQLLMK